MSEADSENDESAIDPDIDELLDAAASTEPDQSAEEQEAPESPQQEEGFEEDSPEDDSEIESSTSWVEILESPQSSPAEEDKRILAWGRFWGELEDIAAAFYLVLTPTDDPFETLRLAVYGNPALLEDFHPRMDADQFEYRLMEYNLQGQAIPKVIFEEVEDGIRNFFEEKDGINRLEEILEDNDEEALNAWLDDLIADIIEDGSFVYQMRARLASAKQLEDDPDDRSAPESTTSESDGEEDTDDSSGGKQLDVSIINSPSSGLPADELSEGTDIFIRIVDDRVKQLPDNLIEQERNKCVSIPLEATVKAINPLTSLPDHISDGDPDDYREVIVELEEAYDGRALVYLEDRLKVEHGSEEGEEDWDEMLVALLFMGLMVLIALIVLIM